MKHPADLPCDRQAAASMARRLRRLYGTPRQNVVVYMATQNYLSRMRRVRAGNFRHQLAQRLFS